MKTKSSFAIWHKSAFYLFVIGLFFLGLLVYATWPLREYLIASRPQVDLNQVQCPDLLIEQDGVLLLYNSLQPEQVGVNPMPFYNLDEYIQHTQRQRSKGIQCPILYVVREFDAQGQSVYRMRQSPIQYQGGRDMVAPPIPTITTPTLGLPSQVQAVAPAYQGSRIDGGSEESMGVILAQQQVNTNEFVKDSSSFLPFDPTSQHVGRHTVMDDIHVSTERAPQSANAMDSNWSGIYASQAVVDAGVYDSRTVPSTEYNANIV